MVGNLSTEKKLIAIRRLSIGDYQEAILPRLSHMR
jgi:hypothetical protein